MARSILYAFLILLFLTTCASTEPPTLADRPSAVDPGASFTEGMKRLAEEIVEGLDAEKKNRIAAFEFTRTKGQEIECGMVIMKSIMAEMKPLCKRTGKCEFVERVTMDRAREELKLGEIDLMDQSKSVDLGLHVGATLILEGMVEPWGEGTIRVWVSLIETETTIIPICCYEDMAYPPSMNAIDDRMTPPDADDLISVHNPNSDIDVEVRTDRAVYHFDDPVILRVRTSRPGYLYLFDIDSHGEQTQLLPNMYQPQPVYLDAGETFVSPAGWYVAGPPTGAGYLKAMITPRPNRHVETDFSDGIVFKSLEEGSTRGVVTNTLNMDGAFGTFHVTIVK